jgi:hypothetical protein
MSQRWKLFLLTALIIILIILTSKVSLNIYRNIKQVHAPTPQSRQDNKLRIHHWETVQDISRKHGISIAEVFSCLHIVPQAGDENLSLRALAKKYNKTQEEMQSILKKLPTILPGRYGDNP